VPAGEMRPPKSPAASMKKNGADKCAQTCNNKFRKLIFVIDCMKLSPYTCRMINPLITKKVNHQVAFFKEIVCFAGTNAQSPFQMEYPTSKAAMPAAASGLTGMVLCAASVLFMNIVHVSRILFLSIIKKTIVRFWSAQSEVHFSVAH